MKSARDNMDMHAAYLDVGTYRGAAEICCTTPKTVKRAVLKRLSGADAQATRHAERAKNTDIVGDVVARRVKSSNARISAKRLLPAAVAAGYTGSARNFRRAVAKAKRTWREEHHRGRRPGVWSPGETLIIDWGAEDGLHVFCAVSAWSRFRFVRFATDEKADTTFKMLAECFEELGGAPKVVLADRMGCLKGGVVANIVVPTPEYVRFCSRYCCRPDFCEGADPESKGMVENLVGYAKLDLLVPQAPFTNLSAANVSAAAWCDEVNAQVHSEICAVPAERLVVERELFSPLPSLRPRIGKAVLRKVDKLSCVRFGSARYSAPLALIGKDVEVVVADGQLQVVHLGVEMARHDVVAPGEASICDDHYGGARPMPRRAPRPRTEAERALVGLGEAGVSFLKAAAAAGATKLGSELPAIVALEHAHGRETLAAALERAVEFRRFSLSDVRSILAAGPGAPRLAPVGEPLAGVPGGAVRSLTAYSVEQAR
ncbi:MAG: IS21 family transposase [Acidimicrobiales bacterium]